MVEREAGDATESTEAWYAVCTCIYCQHQRGGTAPSRRLTYEEMFDQLKLEETEVSHHVHTQA